MFNTNFFPTPKEVIERMLLGVDVYNKVILEPSAGKGDIVDFLQENGAKEVIACLRPIPTFTLQDIIELLPFDVFGSYNFWLMKANGGYKFSVKNNPDSAKIGTHFYDSPLEAAYDILCWYLKKGK